MGLCCWMASVSFPQVFVFIPTLPIALNHHLSWEVTGTVFFWVQVCLLSLPVISVPASSNCAIFQQELPLSSVALSAKLLQGEG